MDERIKKPPVEIPQLDKELRQAFARLTKTEDGVKVMRHIMTECGFKESSMVMNATTNEILPMSSLWNESKRGVWIDVRRMIPHKQLNLIEMER